jgi:hypothetical protein
MSNRGKQVGRASLVGLPVLVVALLWLASGRGVFTASGKAVPVAVRDTLFGDTTVETRFVSGPVFGYYIGLDAVVVLAVLTLVSGLIWWWIARRRRGAKLNLAPWVERTDA